MPVDGTWQHVDKPHDSTVALASEGWRYGCWNVAFATQSVGLSQDGWYSNGARRIKGFKTQWKPNPAGRVCGHLESQDDPACEGCYRRHKEVMG